MIENPQTYLLGKACIPILQSLPNDKLTRRQQAEILNEKGCRTPSGLLWTRTLLKQFMTYQKLKIPCLKNYINPHYVRDSFHGDSCLPILKEFLKKRTLTIGQIATHLNDLGYRTATDLPWTMGRLSNLMSAHGLHIKKH